LNAKDINNAITLQSSVENPRPKPTLIGSVDLAKPGSKQETPLQLD